MLPKPPAAPELTVEGQKVTVTWSREREEPKREPFQRKASTANTGVDSTPSIWLTGRMCFGVCIARLHVGYNLLIRSPGMPDFVYSTTGSAFANRFRERILFFDCGHYIPG
jgi:hypothetical protein